MFGSSSSQSPPSFTATPLFDLQLAVGSPSPSLSFATNEHVPWSASHLPTAQPGGVVDGTWDAQSALVVHPPPPPVESCSVPPSSPAPPLAGPAFPLHAPPLRAIPSDATAVTDIHALLDFIAPAPFGFTPHTPVTR
jgi:hypothetical protein